MIWGLIDRCLILLYLKSSATPTAYLIPPKMSLSEHFKMNVSKGFLKTYYWKLRKNPNVYWNSNGGKFFKGVTLAILVCLWLCSLVISTIIITIRNQGESQPPAESFTWSLIIISVITVFFLLSSYRKIHLNKFFGAVDCSKKASLSKWGAIRCISEEMSYLSLREKHKLSEKFNFLIYSAILVSIEKNEVLDKAVNLKISIIESEIKEFFVKKIEKEERKVKKKSEKKSKKINVKDLEWDTKKAIQNLMGDDSENTVSLIENFSPESLKAIYGLEENNI